MGKSAARTTKPPKAAKPEPLRDGQRLTVAEFMRRYEAMPDGFRAELLNGVVYVNRWFETDANGKVHLMPPIDDGAHAAPQFGMGTVFGVYQGSTPGVRGRGPVTVVLSPVSSGVEPDAVLRVLPESGGQTVIGADGYIHGPPELVVEVANTSVARDLGVKYDTYEQAGVREYVVVRTAGRVVEWFRLVRGRYVPLPPDDDGLFRSRLFPGLWVDPAAVLGEDMPRLLTVLQQGLNSPEHATFVVKLARKKR
jgi:Uma2 family endonuclease